MLKVKKGNNLPTISIVIPAFNKASYIEETLQSIVDQKYPNLEVIIKDGGSTDGTLKIIKKYTNKYPGVFFCKSQTDNGQTDAINWGLKKAKGEVLTYINADDYYERGALLTVGKYFMKYPETVWLAGQGRVVNQKGHEIVKSVTIFKNLLLRINNFTLLLIINYLIQPSVFVSASAYAKFGPFGGIGRVVMEYGLWLRLGSYKMPNIINTPLASFRLVKGGLSLSSFEAILKEDSNLILKFTKSPIIHLFHKAFNLGRIALFARK